MGTDVRIRPVEDDDVELFWQFEQDEEASRRSAFPSRDRDRFMPHWAKIRADPANVLRTVLADDEVAGNVVSWAQDGKQWIGYWLGRDYWGRGVGSRAVRLFLDELTIRPMYADPVEGNTGSVRLLEKLGFRRVDVPEPDTTTYDGEVHQHVLLVLDDQ
jgi:RimJ/RimL family protein N-acetyltransferase